MIPAEIAYVVNCKGNVWIFIMHLNVVKKFRMESIKNYAISLLISIALGGCIFPGSHLSTKEKIILESNDSDDSKDDYSNAVNLYPLTADSVAQFRGIEDFTAQDNKNLDSQLAGYEYRVGPGDILNVTVWDHPDLTIPAGSFRSAAEAGNWVHADGTIFYPYIGSISVLNKTVRQIRQDIARRLAKFIENPQVDVNVAAFRSKKVYITGEVVKSGQQPISNIPLTILDAINAAGGLSANADWHNAILTRNGKEEPISLYGLIQRGDLTQNRLLIANDILHVPLNDKQKVFVMGEVKDPQLLRIERSGMSLTEALSSVGGINELAADATGVFVVRASENKQERLADVFQLDIKDASALVIGTEFDLKPYDIVYVTAAPITRWNRVISQLLPTISGFNELTEGALRVRTWP